MNMNIAAQGTVIALQTTAGANQVWIQHTASANRYITLTGSNGGNPTIGTSAGSLAVTSPIAATGGISTTNTSLAGRTLTVAYDGTYYWALVQQGAGGSAYRAIEAGAGHHDFETGAAGNIQVRIPHTASANRYITLTGSNGGNPTIGTSAGSLAISAALVLSQTTLLATSVALTNGAAAAAGTLLNAPAAGNPTKWIPISDNGTTRYIPAW